MITYNMQTERTAVRVRDCGTFVVLIPLSQPAEAWLAEHLPGDTMRWFPKGYVVEPRYVEAILSGMAEDGIGVEEGR